MKFASQIPCQNYKNKNFYFTRFGTVYATKVFYFLLDFRK